MNVAFPDPLVRVVVIVRSLLSNPVTDLEKVIPTVKVSFIWTPCGSVKRTVGAVVSKLMAGDVCFVAGAVRVPSVEASLATSTLTVPFAVVGDWIVTV